MIKNFAHMFAGPGILRKWRKSGVHVIFSAFKQNLKIIYVL